MSPACGAPVELFVQLKKCGVALQRTRLVPASARGLSKLHYRRHVEPVTLGRMKTCWAQWKRTTGICVQHFRKMKPSH